MLRCIHVFYMHLTSLTATSCSTCSALTSLTVNSCSVAHWRHWQWTLAVQRADVTDNELLQCSALMSLTVYSCSAAHWRHWQWPLLVQSLNFRERWIRPLSLIWGRGAKHGPRFEPGVNRKSDNQTNALPTEPALHQLRLTSKRTQQIILGGDINIFAERHHATEPQKKTANSRVCQERRPQ